MYTFSLKRLLAALLMLALSDAIITLSIAAEQSKRGNYPQCQEECLSMLKKRMAGLSESYKNTGKRLEYEASVEEARLDYDLCIVNCKALLPVK
jgi:hypothetical protein